tara:strand:- start:1849 stop:2091 length:243 start_codon:yes stop_codon:yes gene_type:complete
MVKSKAINIALLISKTLIFFGKLLELGQKNLRHKASPTIIFKHHEHNYSDTKNLKYIRDLLKQFGYITRRIYGNIIAFKS